MTDRLRRLGFALVLASSAFASAAEVPVTVYVGTYTDGTSRGIYRTSLDTASGKATAPVLAVEAKNPSFLALHPSGRFLYAVSEVDEFRERKTGAVMAFAIDPKTGDLTLLNQQPSEGGAPCHLVVDRSGKNLLVANYGGGTVAVLRIGRGRTLAAGVGREAARGQGPQHRAPAEAARPRHLPRRRRALRVRSGPRRRPRVRLPLRRRRRARSRRTAAAAVAPGSGPRHLAFHPKGRHAYVINELSSTRSPSSATTPAKGELAPIETV